jgi:hypothetical protein
VGLSFRWFFASAIASVAMSAVAQSSAPLELVETIVLPDVNGRIDHLAIDTSGERLFVPIVTS